MSFEKERGVTDDSTSVVAAGPRMTEQENHAF